MAGFDSLKAFVTGLKFTLFPIPSTATKGTPVLGTLGATGDRTPGLRVLWSSQETPRMNR